MPYNEEETKHFLITPKLSDKKWIGSECLSLERPIAPGKVIIEGDKVSRKGKKRADYVLKYHNVDLAVVEAKDESHSPFDGMQQAKMYAERLDVKFAYSSNGHGIEEFDFFTNQQKTIDHFPTPEELWERFNAGHKIIPKYQQLLNIPFYTTDNKAPRYYQKVAVNRALEAFAKGDKRLLLNLATGTGKTFIAFQIAWKLKQAGFVKRVLFLADRNVLCEQAYNAFDAFGNARDYIKEGHTPTAREVYFSIYQAMFAEKDGKRLYQHYPKDFFDLIIIDECHRSGFGSWNDILSHFNTSVQLGMTATPKESENVNTYKYFGNPKAHHKALYEYSMSTGIDDGFLANFVLHRYKLNVESGLIIEEALNKGAEVEVPDGANIKEEYGAKEYELDVTLPDRTKAMCDKLAALLKQYGEMHKTIVFCVTMEHAREVAKQMQNHFSHLGYSNYAVTIVSEENDAQSLLKVFQDETTDRPVVATTVDLLSTGFDAPSVRNIVFMKYISSPIMFKQILGRGSRISEDNEKYYFRLIDFTNASRLIDKWVTGEPDVQADRTGDNLLCGFVKDKESGKPIPGARVIAQLTPNQQRSTLTNQEGYFLLHALPEGSVNVSFSAYNYGGRQGKYFTAAELTDPLKIELVRKGTPPPPIKVKGLNVVFDEETVFEVEVTGQRLTLKEYIDYARQKIAEQYKTAENLRTDWADRDKRKEVVEDLARQGINPEILATATQQPEADELDLLANIAFDKEIHTRKERADALKNLQQDFINSFSDDQRKIIQQLLFYYQLNGADEFANPRVFDLIFPNGGAMKASEKFGTIDNLISALTQLQKRIYAT